MASLDIPARDPYSKDNVVEFKRASGMDMVTSIGKLGTFVIKETQSEFASGNQPHHHRLPFISPSEWWTVHHLADVSDWRATALQEVPESSILGRWTGPTGGGGGLNVRQGGGGLNAQKGDKGMLGKNAYDESGHLIGTVVGVDTLRLYVRDEDAQYEWIQISDVTLKGETAKSKFKQQGSCPVLRYKSYV